MIKKLREEIKKYTDDKCVNVDLLDKFGYEELERINDYIGRKRNKEYKIFGFSEEKGNYSITDTSESRGNTFILRTGQYSENENKEE